MKLKPIQSLPSMKLAGRVPGELHADPTAYATYYREVVGQPIALSPPLSCSWMLIATSRRGGGGSRTGPAADR